MEDNLRGRPQRLLHGRHGSHLHRRQGRSKSQIFFTADQIFLLCPGGVVAGAGGVLLRVPAAVLRPPAAHPRVP